MSRFTPLRSPLRAPSVSDAETHAPKRGRVWQTVAVTFGRIIIGWRGGPQGQPPRSSPKNPARRRADLSRIREGSFVLPKPVETSRNRRKNPGEPEMLDDSFHVYDTTL